MKYLVSGHMTISMSVEIEAKSPEEAKKRAAKAPIISLCRQCAEGEPGEWVTSGELDGSICSIEIVDVEEM
jgi:hypothetical protein